MKIAVLLLLFTLSSTNLTAQTHKEMKINKNAETYLQQTVGDAFKQAETTDPELMERWENFTFGEVSQQTANVLDPPHRFMVNMATLLGCQGLQLYQAMLPGALRTGLSAIAIKEVLYQAVDYLGMGRVYPFIEATNNVFIQQGIALPLESQATTSIAADERIQAGNEIQIEIFGEGMRGFQNKGPEATRHLNKWLAGNCFGDFYTRKGLTLKEREIITFCFIAGQGGCEPQLKAHATGCLNSGNTAEEMIAVISANLPLIGYPRTLNALSCLNETIRKE